MAVYRYLYTVTDLLICYGDKLVTTSQWDDCASHYIFACEIIVNI